MGPHPIESVTSQYDGESTRNEFSDYKNDSNDSTAIRDDTKYANVQSISTWDKVYVEPNLSDDASIVETESDRDSERDKWPYLQETLIFKFMEDQDYVHDYVHPYYSRDTYLQIYGGSIKPMAGPEQWPLTDKIPPLPPHYNAKPGRPKMLRKKSADEHTKDGERVSRTKIKLHCTKCKKQGHNCRRCPENPKTKQKQMKPRKRGRSNVPIVNQDSMPELEIIQDSNEDCANAGPTPTHK